MRRRERGSALLIAIVALVVVSIAAQAVHGILIRGVQGFQAERSSVQLRALTDAALAATLARLSEDPTVRRVAKQRLGTGFFESRVRELEPGIVEILATAETGRRRSAVRAVASLGPAGLRVVAWEPSAVAAFAVRQEGGVPEEVEKLAVAGFGVQ